MRIIGINGGLQHGKDSIAKAIVYLTSDAKEALSFEKFVAADIPGRKWKSVWERVRFAEKLKIMVALIIGCRREQLEDEAFKNKPLGPEWNRYNLIEEVTVGGVITERVVLGTYVSYKEALLNRKDREQIEGYENYVEEVVMTPRLMLQLLGTEGMRDVIHPNIHVNALFADYKPVETLLRNVPLFEETKLEHFLPYWIIPDMRFPNEMEAIQKRGGLTIKVVNPRITTVQTHASETALKNATFDEMIVNDGDLDKLCANVEIIMQHYNLL